jgi:hypothetical protein
MDVEQQSSSNDPEANGVLAWRMALPAVAMRQA